MDMKYERVSYHDAPSLLSAVEHEDRTVSENDDSNLPIPTRCLHDLFALQVRRTPDALALVCGERKLTYSQLDRQANQWAHRLQQLGGAPNTLVGLYTERSVEMIVGLLAILKAGMAYLPIDPAYPPERLAFMLEDAQAPLLLTQQALRADLPPVTAQVLCLDTDRDATLPETSPAHRATPEHLAYVLYTSGSTGKPKGVLVTHRNVARLFCATEPWFRFGPDDVWTLFHSIAFDFSVWEVWGALLYGGRLVITPFAVSRSPQAFYDLLRRERVTILNQTPSAFYQLMTAEAGHDPDALALRVVIFGGEVLNLPALLPWVDRHGDRRPQLVNMYGITETTVHVTYRPLTREDLLARNGSVIGRPIPDLRLYVLDQNRQPAPAGAEGEIYVGGEGVACGYLNRPELTAERFLHDPFSGEPGARLYRSGDLARYLPNGDLEYLGRADQQVKLRGFRVETGEIEAVLQAHPQIEQAAVLLREDTPGDQRLVAYLVCNPKSPTPLKAVRDLAADQLPAYMVPSAYMFLDSLPLTPHGKLDRGALPAPSGERDVIGPDYLTPRDPLEEQLVALMEEVLGVRPIGVRDDFFALGGNSQLAVQYFSRIEQKLGRRPEVAILFTSSTVETLADAMREKPARAQSGLLAAIRTYGSKLPLYCIHPDHGSVVCYRSLAEHLSSDYPVYGLQALGLLDGHLPDYRVEVMASHYVSALIEKDPIGPYCLAGHSFGGVVAYEMAQQLRAAGKNVALVALFDTYGPAYFQGEMPKDAARPIHQRLIYHLRVLRRLEMGDRKLYVISRMTGLVKGVRQMTGNMLRRVHSPSRRSLPEVIEEIIRINNACLRDYRPGPALGPVTLFRAQEHDVLMNARYVSDLFWGDQIDSGRLVLRDVPGDHWTMMEEPFVKSLAGELQICLDEAQSSVKVVTS